MAEFVEVMKNRKRMCDSYGDGCGKCALSLLENGTNIYCTAFIKDRPAEAEKIIMDWTKEHPIKTNADKFREVFGFDLENYSESCIQFKVLCNSKDNCENCKYDNFWRKEYKEHKEND